MPAAVTAIGSASLTSRGIRSVADAINVAPSVQVVSPYGDGAPPNYTVRGISSTDPSHNQSKPIAIYIDEGIRDFQLFELMPLFDVDRVEILSGPQGTLYGKNATGGAVNIYTRAPTFDTEGYLTAGYGNFNTRHFQGAFQTPLVSDVLSTRLAFTYTKDDGTIHQLTPGLGNPAQTDIFAIRGSLRFKPDDNFDATLRAYHVQSGGRNYTNYPGDNPNLSAFPNLATVPGAERQGAGFYQSADDSTPHRDIQSEGVNLLMKWKPISGVALTSVTTWDKGHWHDVSDADGLPVDLYFTNLYSRASQFVQELRAASDTDGPFRWSSGVFYSKDKIFFRQELDYFEDQRCGAACDFAITPNGTGENTVNSFTQRRHSLSGYVRGEYSLTSRLTVSGGVRQSHDHLGVSNYSAYIGDTSAPLSIPVFTGIDTSKNFNNTSFEAGLNYKLNRSLLFYGTFKQAYRTGAVNGSALTAPSEVDIAPPEKAHAFEIGAKTSWLDRRLTVDIALFDTTYIDQQIQASEVVNGLQTFPLKSIDRSRIRGIEGTVIARPLTWANLSITASADDPKYIRGQVSGTSVAGNTIVNSAKYKVGIAGDFNLIKNDDGRIDLNVNGDYSSRTFYDVFDTRNISQPGYWLWNSRLSVEHGRWSLAAYTRNIFDKKYIVFGLSTEQTLGFNYRLRGVPRQFGLEASVKF